MSTPNLFEGLPKPLPVATETSAPFWEGLRQGEVRLQRCEACGAWVFYPRSNCPRCLAHTLGWQTVSGRGVLHTFTVTSQPTNPLFAEDVPQRLAIVELEEGVHVPSTLVDVDPASIEIGMALEPH